MTTVAAEPAAWTDRAAIDAFVRTSPQGSVFARPALLDALGRPWEFRLLGDTGRPRAAALLFRDPAGIPARAPLPFCLYQGIMLPPQDGRPAHRVTGEELAAVTELLAGLEGESRLSWCLHPSLTDIRALSWFHHGADHLGSFVVDVRYTGVIAFEPGEDFDAALARCRSVRRQEYRKAAARFQVGLSDDLDLLDTLHAATFARQGLERPVAEPVLLRAIASAALTGGFGELLVAKDTDGTAAGAVLMLVDDRTAYYLVAANDPAFRNAGVSTLLVLSLVKRALERGIRRIDMVGMNSPARGDFKSSFGAVPVPYYVVTWERP